MHVGLGNSGTKKGGKQRETGIKNWKENDEFRAVVQGQGRGGGREARSSSWIRHEKEPEMMKKSLSHKDKQMEAMKEE